MKQSLDLRMQPNADRYTLPRFLEDVAERHGDRLAIRGDSTEISYRGLRSEARKLARGLVAAGVGKGSRVAVFMENGPEWAVAMFGASLVGAVVVPVNTFARPDELDHILRHSDASTLILQKSLDKHAFLDEFLARHDTLATDAPGQLGSLVLPQLRRIVVLGLGVDEGPGPGIERFEDLLASGADVPESLLDEIAKEIVPSDDALIIYTSGTTALPKGVLHMQRAPVIQSWRFAEDMELGCDDVVWSTFPFFWTAGIAMALGASLAAGSLLVVEAIFDPERALARIEKVGATTVQAWPHQEKALAEHPSARARDLSKVTKIEFANPLARIVGLEKDEWGMYGSYGLSETFTITSSLPACTPAEKRAKTSGLPLPGMLMRIVDPETGEELESPCEGEIAVKGITFMRGYYKVEPELTVDENGFFRTQDGGFFDAEGYLHWKGRLSNLIKTGGANVSPLEIEAALADREDLRVGLAVGVPHPVLGEVIVLCAVAAAGMGAPSEADVLTFLRQKIAAYKVPKRVFFFEAAELSFTGNQKIQVGPLREAALRRLEEEEAEIEGNVYRDIERA